MGARQSLVILGIALLAACSGAAKPGTGEQAGAKPDAGEQAAAQGERPGGDKAGASKAGASKGDESKEGSGEVVLTADEVARIGITTAAVQAVTYTPGAQGFGVVVSHDVIAQVAADLQTATAAIRQSQAALARGRRLASGPGALGTDALESAARQVAADQAALELSRRKLTATLGQDFPRQRHGAEGLLNDLANGTLKLARITFPPGALGSARPKSLRVSLLDSASQVPTSTTSELWDAPQDPTLPGRSFFALLSAPEIPEGARLQALAVSTGGGTPGALIPTAAVVVSNGQPWCYVQKNAGTFERTPIDTSRPLADGYFTSVGVSPGDQVVISAAGLLLARQMNASTEAAD